MTMVFALVISGFVAVQTPAQTLPQAATASAETYESAGIDADGNLRILTSEQRTVIVPKGGSPK